MKRSVDRRANGQSPGSLPAEKARRECPLSAIPFRNTDEVEGEPDILGQERAQEALGFGIAIEHEGYNLVALGPEGIGKQSLLRGFLESRARQAPTPEDWCHAMNWSNPARPLAFSLPAGRGARLRDELQEALKTLRRALPVAFASEEYRTRKQRLDRALQEERARLLDPVRARAAARGISLGETESGLLLEPDCELDELSVTEREALKIFLDSLEVEIESLFGQLLAIDQRYAEGILTLERELASGVARQALQAVRASHADLPRATAFLAELEARATENYEEFQDTESSEPGEGPELNRYQLNLVIDNGKQRGAPVVYEDNPTSANLIGQVQQISWMGTLVTDFTLIRPGAFHRARGGYLLLDLAKLIERPDAWKALKRALRAGEFRPRPPQSPVAPRLDVQPIPLASTKVLLLGDRELYEAMLAADPDFPELFKVVVEFEETLPREGAEGRFARTLARLVAKMGLRPFERPAIARLVEEAARRAEDATRLSLHMRPLADLLVETDYWAGHEGCPVASARHVETALAAQRRRASRPWEAALEQIRRNSVLVDTEGEQVGRVNALSVVQVGQHSFGLPNRVSARVWPGKPELLDVEREVDLGGPIHSKGMLILRAYLAAHYATHHLLAVSGSLVFEQSYSVIEGDSASLAELCALLSALAESPARQALAVTGSVNQHGQVQSIGGVNEKVEGFFEVCRQRGLTGRQGVILPASNVQNLMLSSEVVEAVRAGRFHVFPVERVDDALALLLVHDDLKARIQARLASLSQDARGLLAGGLA